MRFFYTISLRCYVFFISLASVFGHAKAKLWLHGRKTQAKNWLGEPEGGKWIWFHVSSLGEFEQGRPLMEHFAEKKPEYKILLTFFSPSGYEVRKNYDKADKVLYLPIDSKANACRLISKFHPEMAFFVKYEFWFNYLKALSLNNISLYLVSGIFRAKQHFFRLYGGWFRKNLRVFTTFFVQDETSRQLLEGISYQNVVVCGDTRFDRVVSIASSAVKLNWIEQFSKGHKVYVAGSSWEPDDAFVLKLIEKEPEVKFILVPHDVYDARINDLMSKCPQGSIKYSEKDNHKPENVQVLVIDSVGMLSSLYFLADMAHIGNGFGSGIHNIAEAAVYDLPVIFGPQYHKFREAVDLIELGGAFSFKNDEEYFALCKKLLHDDKIKNNAGKIAGNYIRENSGATEKIIEALALSKD